MLKAQADLQKAQTDLQKSQADLERVQAERDAIQAKSQLELECLRRESEARVNASTASAANAAQAQRHRTCGTKVRSPPEVVDLSPQFGGLPQEEIIEIFQNKFKPFNLYRLRHMRGLTFEAYKDEERIGIEDGMLKLRKASGTYKDYSESSNVGVFFFFFLLSSVARYRAKLSRISLRAALSTSDICTYLAFCFFCKNTD